MPGPDGSRLWRGRSHGQTCGGQSHTVLDSWYKPSMMFFPAHPTCTAGAWPTHHSAPCARERAHWSIFYAAVQRHWGMVGTAGGMTKCSRLSQKASVVPLPASGGQDPQRKPSASSELERNQRQYLKQQQSLFIQLRTGSRQWT